MEGINSSLEKMQIRTEEMTELEKHPLGNHKKVTSSDSIIYGV